MVISLQWKFSSIHLTPSTPNHTVQEEFSHLAPLPKGSARLEAVSNRAFSERLVEKRGGGGDNGGMDIIQYRLGLLEKGQEKTDGKIDSLHVRVDGVQASVNTVGEKVSGISGRLDLIEKKLPNWWQPYAGISVVGAIFAALAKFLAN